MKVLVINDDINSRSFIKTLLLRWGYDVLVVEDGKQALSLLKEKDSPCLILLDRKIEGLDSLELCRRIRELADYPYHYIILLTWNSNKKELIAGLEAGADDYIIKPFSAEILEVRLHVGTRILALQQSLWEALDMHRYHAQHDSLTEILNRKEILNILDKELKRAQRHKTNLAVMMGDLDHFKRVNDTYGHVVGDAVLVEVASRLKNNIRLYDSVGRYGGEEFLLVLPGCNKTDGLLIAKRILESISSKPVMYNGIPIKVTISLGLAVYSGFDSMTSTQIIQAADNALYKAKQNGRNRVEYADERGEQIITEIKNN